MAAGEGPGQGRGLVEGVLAVDVGLVREQDLDDLDVALVRRQRQGRGAVIARGLSGQPRGETAFGVSAAKKDLETAVQFAASMHAALPVASSALACFEEAEATGLGEADATTISVRWPQRSVAKSN